MTLRLMIGACHALAVTLYFLGDFETAQQYAMRGVQIWRSGGVQSPVEEVSAPAVIVYAMRPYPSGISERSPLARQTMAEAISLAKELNDMHGLAVALYCAAVSRPL